MKRPIDGLSLVSSKFKVNIIANLLPRFARSRALLGPGPHVWSPAVRDAIDKLRTTTWWKGSQERKEIKMTTLHQLCKERKLAGLKKSNPGSGLPANGYHIG